MRTSSTAKPLHAQARRLLQRLQTQRTSAPVALKLVLGTLMLGIFAPWWGFMRLRAMMRGVVSIETQTARGIRMECQLPDMIQAYLYLFGEWEPDIAAFISQRLRDVQGRSVIDIGANVGYFTLLAARELGAGSSVVAIEASPRIFSQLKGNLALNDLECEVRLVNKAASDIKGKLQLFQGPAHNTGLTSTRQHRGMIFEHEVEAEPVSQLLSDEELEHARLIKVDVEGGEDAVLAGLVDCLEHLPPDVEILVELSPTWWGDKSKSPHDVLAPFVAAGFHVYTISNNYWPWRYMWPACVVRPQRMRGDLRRRVSRLDLVLSRIDAATL